MIERTPSGYDVTCDWCQTVTRYAVGSAADLMGLMSEDGWRWVSGARVSVPEGWHKCAVCVEAPPTWRRSSTAKAQGR